MDFAYSQEQQMLTESLSRVVKEDWSFEKRRKRQEQAELDSAAWNTLAELGVLLRSHFAGRGMAARYGGEEFVAVMPGTDLHTAELQCEFLRLAVADLPLGFPVTISIGVAQHQAGESVDDMLARADKALYRAKGNGRNRVERAG